jgi:hypothetical protein
MGYEKLFRTAYKTVQGTPFKNFMYRAFLYAPYSFLLITNKFWLGGRVGEQCTYLIKPHCRGGTGWALKPP